MKIKWIEALNASELEKAINALFEEDKRWRTVTIYHKSDKIVAWMEWSAQ